MALISIKEWAEKNGKSSSSASSLIVQGRLPEAQRTGWSYVIEESTPFPADKRFNVIDSQVAVDAYEKTGSIRQAAFKLGISATKVRKMLITAGVYETKTSVKLRKLQSEGGTVAEIAERLGVTRQTVHAYLPYPKSVHHAEGPSDNVKKIRTHRGKGADEGQNGAE